MTLPTPPRKQWFLDRIGTRVWPSNGEHSCKCPVCRSALAYGVFITNEYKALLTYNIECESDTIYFETKEERDEHERDKK